MKFPRRSGVLLPLTSLPGSFGIGDLGRPAREFIDRLADSGQRYWQILPLNPTGPGNSPYASTSAFAGNRMLLGPRKLYEDGLLEKRRLSRLPKFPAGRVDYTRVVSWKEKLLADARKSFRADAGSAERRSLEDFCRDNSPWLEDYAFFSALKSHFQGKPWYRWPRSIAARDPETVKKWRDELGEEMEEVRFYQFLFFRQWDELRRYAAGRGVEIIGDIPFFVSHDSADVWGNPGFFLMDKTGRRTVLSGAPPSGYFGVSQKWGNPLYDWEAMAEDGYRWWYRRLSAILDLVDIVRVDHCSGFYACWHIPPAARSSKKGRWVKGPGARLFQLFRKNGVRLPIIAEALEPEIDREVRRLLEELEFPPVRVLQFGLDENPDNPHNPDNYPENSVLYTGTHDTDTSLGWFEDLPASMKKQALRYLGAGPEKINWRMIRFALSTRADTVIIPLQDICGLGSSARINTPGQGRRQWEWRLKENELKPEFLKKLAELTEGTGR